MKVFSIRNLSLIMILSFPVFAGPAANVASQSSKQVIKQVLTSKTGKVGLAVACTLAGVYGIHRYRTSRPVRPSGLNRYSPEPYSSCCPQSDEVVTLFAHGLGGTADQAGYFKDVLPGSIYAFNFPDAPEMSSSLKHTGLAQPVEVQQLRLALQQLGDKPEVEHIFVYGISRGASTVINLLKGDVPHIKKIRGIIVESPFANLDDIIQLKLQQIGIQGIPGVRWLGHGLVKCLYNQYSLSNQPIDDLATVSDAAKKLPICMLCSTGDTLIPASSTERLANQMKTDGFTHVTLHTENWGSHGSLLWNGGAAYQSLFNTFTTEQLNTFSDSSSSSSSTTSAAH